MDWSVLRPGWSLPHSYPARVTPLQPGLRHRVSPWRSVVMARGSSPSPLRGGLTSASSFIQGEPLPCASRGRALGLPGPAAGGAQGPRSRAPGGRGSAVTGVAGVGAQEGAGRRPAVQRRSRKASGLGATEPGLCFHRSKTYVTQNLPCNRVKCAALRCRSHHDHPHPKPEATEHF